MTRPAPLPRARKGVTLVEMLIAMVLFSIVISATSRTLVTSQSTMVRQRGHVRADEALLVATSTLSTILRQTGADALGSAPDLLTPGAPTNGVFNTVRVAADFNPVDGDVNDPLEDVEMSVFADTLRVRWQSGQPFRPAAFPIRSIAFSYFSRAGTLLTTTTGIRDSTARVRITVVAPSGPKNQSLRTSVVWVAMRNRR
jgi:prepilin-type N-terminal cleavage/methylation domain-containing protein